ALADAAIFSAAVEAGDFLQADAVLVSHGTHDGAVEALAVGARHGRVALWPALLGIGFCLGAYCYGFFFLAGFTVAGLLRFFASLRLLRLGAFGAPRPASRGLCGGAGFCADPGDDLAYFDRVVGFEQDLG